MNSGTYQITLHLTAQPAPSITPQASRHHGIPARENRGRPARPLRVGSSPFSIAVSQRLRRWSRSSSRQPKAARAKNSTKMSRIAVRDSTSSKPSNAISSPAVQPSTVERNIRRPIRATMSTASVPQTAAPNRHPNAASNPCERAQPLLNSLMPSAMIHLPSGGWTT